MSDADALVAAAAARAGAMFDDEFHRLQTWEAYLEARTVVHDELSGTDAVRFATTALVYGLPRPRTLVLHLRDRLVLAWQHGILRRRTMVRIIAHSAIVDVDVDTGRHALRILALGERWVLSFPPRARPLYEQIARDVGANAVDARVARTASPR